MTTWSRAPFRGSDFVCGCTVCGRDEHELLHLASPTDVADEFVPCQCTLCGNGGCSVLVHPVRLNGRSDWRLEDIDAIARSYCGDCEQYQISLQRQRISELRRKQDQLEQRGRRRDESATDGQPSSKKFKSS